MRRSARRTAGTATGCAGGQPRSRPQSLTTACSRPSAQQASSSVFTTGQSCSVGVDRARALPCHSTFDGRTALSWSIALQSIARDDVNARACRRLGKGATDRRFQPGSTGSPVGWIQAVLVRKERKLGICVGISAHLLTCRNSQRGRDAASAACSNCGVS